jgi:hypothetical protein
MLFIQRIVGVIIGALALIAAVFFSVVVFVVVVVIAACIMGYIWWKTRALRRAARSMEPPHTGRTIDSTEIYEVHIEKIEEQTRPPNERP